MRRALAENFVIEWGAAERSMERGQPSGDRYVAQAYEGGALLAAIDGLGHGAEAAAAALAAREALLRHAGRPVVDLVVLCHDQLTRTRGAVITLASVDARLRRMTWVAVGNVAGLLARRDPGPKPPRAHLFNHAGVVGYQLPTVRADVVPLAPGDVLVFATDGIDRGFGSSVSLQDEPQDLADRILARHARPNDDALVLVARFGEGAL